MNKFGQHLSFTSGSERMKEEYNTRYVSVFIASHYFEYYSLLNAGALHILLKKTLVKECICLCIEPIKEMDYYDPRKASTAKPTF